MNRLKKHLLSMVLAIAVICSMCPMAAATEMPAEGKCAVFSHISQMKNGEHAQQTILDANGEKVTVTIEKVAQSTRANGETWLVQYKAIGVTVEFYMTVSNNKVTSVYDYYISLVGSTYDDADLTKTSTYGKLTFTHKWLGGLGASTCWLKGTVTGEDDQIKVTWQM